jgi:hypothetical protein
VEWTGADIWDDAASETLYANALREGAAIANLSVSSKFEESWRKTWSEYVEFLGNVGRGTNVETTTDLDVIAFVQGGVRMVRSWGGNSSFKTCYGRTKRP